MSNVQITAVGEGLSVEIMLGDANRGWRDIEEGETVDMAVGGNQFLRIGIAREPATPFITPDDEPTVTTPFAVGADDLPIGVDVLGDGDVQAEAEPLEDAKDYEKFEVGAGDVGDVEDLGIIKNLESDSPLEVGALSDLPSPFDTEEEAEDTDSEAQA